MDYKKLVGERIRKLREDRGLNQRQLSGQLGKGISNKQISYWENGDREVSLGDLVELSRFFGVSTDYLLGVSNYPNPTIQAEAREIDFTLEIAREVFTSDNRAEQFIDFLYQGISREIILWETSEHSGYTKDSGALALLEYFIALMECIRRCNDSRHHKDDELILFKLLNGFREYIGDVVERSFGNEDVVRQIKNRIPTRDIDREVYEIFESVWRG